MTLPTLTVSIGRSGWILGDTVKSVLGTTTYLGYATFDDITSKVRQVSIRRGRQHELDRVEAGTATVVLMNQDGVFDPMNQASPYWPDIRPMVPLRIQATFDLFPSIAGLMARYDFSDISTLFQDTARTIPITADAQVIKGVADKSGNGNHLSEATNGPTYKVNIVNSQSIARFDGTNDVLAPATNPSSGSAGTMFYVQRVVSEGTSQVSPWSKAGSAADGDHHPFSDANIYDGFGSTARKATGNPSGDLSAAFYIFTVVSAASDYRAYKDGGTAYFSTGTNTVGWSGTAPTMAYDARVPDFSATDISEVIVYNGALSSADINRVGTYLGTKWGITWTTVP